MRFWPCVVYFAFGVLPIALQGICFPVPARQYYSKSLENHPGHFPFISSISFRHIADHAIDQNSDWFDPDQVKLGDVIYLNIWFLEWFVQCIHDRIPYPYILISADVGDWVPNPAIKKLLYDPKLAAWFCRNMIFSFHPKLIQIPMGQDWSLFTPSTSQIGIMLEEMDRKREKKHLLYMNHYPRTHGDRDKIAKMFENKPYCFSKNKSDQPFSSTPFDKYCEELAASCFTLSPIGLEMDCVRTWEALALGTIPIVEHTFLDPLYEDLPVLIVSDWEEISEELLNAKYLEMNQMQTNKAFCPYWFEKIKTMQERIRNGDIEFSKLESTKFSVSDLRDLETIFSDFTKVIYKGFLTSIRPLQIAKQFSFLSKIYLYDPWLDLQIFNEFADYLDDPAILSDQDKIELISPYWDEDADRNMKQKITDIHEPYAFFLDFTYYRNSLLSDFSKDFTHPRHLLKKQLMGLCKRLPLFTRICGNCSTDKRVGQILDEVCMELRTELIKQGNFWYMNL